MVSSAVHVNHVAYAISSRWFKVIKNLKNHKYSIWLISTCFGSGQRKPPPQRNRNQSNRNRQRVRVKPKFTIKKKQTMEANQTQIQCLVCGGEFLVNTFDAHHLCYNPGLNASAARQSLLSSCPLDSRYCVTEVTRVHGVFICENSRYSLTVFHNPYWRWFVSILIAAINRRCGGNFCVEACFQKGFGTERESCTYCCEPVRAHHFTMNEEQIDASTRSMHPIESTGGSVAESMVAPNHTNRTKGQALAIQLNNELMADDPTTSGTNLTIRQQKELLQRQQAIQMLSAYNCPPSYRNEF